MEHKQSADLLVSCLKCLKQHLFAECSIIPCLTGIVKIGWFYQIKGHSSCVVMQKAGIFCLRMTSRSTIK